MFFDKKQTEKRVAPGELPETLLSLFNSKLAPLEPRASGIVARLRAVKSEFAASCDAFERLNAEPDTEDMWNPNINAIKTQKSAYSTALRNLIGELDLENTDANIYVRYKTILGRVEATVDKILRANANFKTVLYCYSKHLGSFKKHFSSIEKLRDALSEELEKRIGDYEAYCAITGDMAKFSALSEQMAALSSGIEALSKSAQVSDPASIDAEEQALGQTISAKSDELSAVQGSISGVSSKLELLTAPLVKVSRKFDHDVQKKPKLAYFMEDPISAIKNRHDYEQFMGMVAELRMFVDGSSDIKNKAELLEALSDLTAAEPYVLIEDLSLHKSRRSAIEAEIRGMERVMDGLKAGRDSMSKSAQEMKRLDHEVDGVTRYRAVLRSQIEKEILDNYKMQVYLVL